MEVSIFADEGNRFTSLASMKLGYISGKFVGSFMNLNTFPNGALMVVVFFTFAIVLTSFLGTFRVLKLHYSSSYMIVNTPLRHCLQTLI